VSAIWRYFIYSVLVGGYSSSINSSPFFMILSLFKSNLTLFKGPKEARGARARDLEIFCIFCSGR
jgi:hypothetical protein